MNLSEETKKEIREFEDNFFSSEESKPLRQLFHQCGEDGLNYNKFHEEGFKIVTAKIEKWLEQEGAGQRNRLEKIKSLMAFCYQESCWFAGHVYSHMEEERESLGLPILSLEKKDIQNDIERALTDPSSDPSFMEDIFWRCIAVYEIDEGLKIAKYFSDGLRVYFIEILYIRTMAMSEKSKDPLEEIKKAAEIADLLPPESWKKLHIQEKFNAIGNAICKGWL